MKTILLTYLGTTIKPYGPSIRRLINRAIADSEIKSMEDFFEIWWRRIRDLEVEYSNENFLPMEDIMNKTFALIRDEYKLTENAKDLIALIKDYWKSAPIYPDVMEFVEKCSCQVFIACNIGAPYVAKCLENAHLRVNGIYTGELEHVYKPNPEYYYKALELFEVPHSEVIFIGTDPHIDYEVPRSLGMHAYLVDRHGNADSSMEDCVKDLRDLLPKIRALS